MSLFDSTQDFRGIFKKREEKDFISFNKLILLD